MESRNAQSGFRLEGRIERKTHDISDLKEAYPNWDEMSEQEKLEASRSVEPTETDVVYNVTTDSLHEYFVDNLDPNNSSVEANVDISWMQLGSGGTGGTSTADTTLNTPEYKEAVTDVADNGKEILASTFLDSTEGNGTGSVTYDEIGLWTGDPANSANAEVFLMNHAVLTASVTKDNSKTVTFDVTLTFADA